MPLKELLADGDVRDRDDPGARIMLDHAVDEQGRKTIAEPVEQLGNIGGHEESWCRHGSPLSTGTGQAGT